MLANFSGVGNASPNATATSTTIKISNEYLTITLSADTGSILTIVDNATGLNLTNVSGGYRALWGVNLTDATTAPFADNNSSGKPSVTLTQSNSEASVTLVWKGLNFNTGLKIGTAVITTKIVLRSNNPLSSWSFQANAIGGINATQLQFPLISSVGMLGPDGSNNRLLIPEQEGRIFVDPIGSRKNFGGLYPSSFMSMQFEAYYNSQAGFYMGAYDTTGQTKTINWYSPPIPANSAIWTTFHYFPDQPANDLFLPYDVAVGVFHGDWTAAADIYKSWAKQQSWVQNSEKKPLPSWFRQAPYGRGMCLHKCGGNWESSFSDLVLEQSKNLAVLDGAALVFPSGWEKMGAWYYGDDIPPFEGWNNFDQMVNSLHQQGNSLNLFVGANKLDNATPLFQSGAAASSVMKRKDGTAISELNIQGSISHVWSLMNPASDFWRQSLINSVSNLASHGVDAIQFDGWPIQEPQDDYSPGHPQGKGGNWQWLAWQQLLMQVEQAGRAILPSMSFSTETGHELLLPLVTYSEVRDPGAEAMGYSSDGSPVPLFGYVYKPNAQAMTDYWGDLPESFHRLAYGRALVWGQRPPFIYGNLGGISTERLQYYSAIGKARSQYSRFLIDGSMLPSPQIATQKITFKLVGDGANTPEYTRSADAIQVGAWLSVTGEIGLIMTNISSEAVQFDLPINFERLKMVPGKSFTIMLESNGSLQSIGSISNTTAFPVKLLPNQIAAITLQSQRKAGDCNDDDVVTIAEVQSAINMFLGLKTAEACVDQDGSGAVSIAEVQKVINSFLGL
jgi:hypothetical protein